MIGRHGVLFFPIPTDVLKESTLLDFGFDLLLYIYHVAFIVLYVHALRERLLLPHCPYFGSQVKTPHGLGLALNQSPKTCAHAHSNPPLHNDFTSCWGKSSVTPQLRLPHPSTAPKIIPVCPPGLTCMACGESLLQFTTRRLHRFP